MKSNVREILEKLCQRGRHDDGPRQGSVRFQRAAFRTHPKRVRHFGLYDRPLAKCLEAHAKSIVLIAGFIVVAGCRPSEQPAAVMPPQVVNVVAFESKQQPISERLSLVGSLSASAMVEIKSEIDGVVEAIEVMEGQRVHAGDVLFRIDQAKLEATLRQAEANLQLAVATAARYELLVQSRAVSQQEYDQTVATQAAAKATVELCREQLRDATIKASFDGVMGARLVSLGQFVTKETSLSFLVSQDPIVADFAVPERFVSKLRVGQTVEIRTTAYPDESFSGTVYFIDPRMDARSRTALIKAYLPNSDGRLKSGMFVNLDLIVATRDQAVVIPESALITQGNSVFVFVVDENNNVARKTIKTGIRFDGMVEVTDGLTAGDDVVTEGHQKIHEGAIVKPRYEGPSS